MLNVWDRCEIEVVKIKNAEILYVLRIEMPAKLEFLLYRRMFLNIERIFYVLFLRYKIKKKELGRACFSGTGGDDHQSTQYRHDQQGMESAC